VIEFIPNHLLVQRSHNAGRYLCRSLLYGSAIIYWCSVLTVLADTSAEAYGSADTLAASVSVQVEKGEEMPVVYVVPSAPSLNGYTVRTLLLSIFNFVREALTGKGALSL